MISPFKQAGLFGRCLRNLRIPIKQPTGVAVLFPASTHEGHHESYEYHGDTGRIAFFAFVLFKPMPTLLATIAIMPDHHHKHFHRDLAYQRSGDCTFTNDGRSICNGSYQAAVTPLDAGGNRSRCAERGSIIGSRPAGCPHRYCGCGLRKYLGISDARLNLASNWARLLPREGGLRPGLAAVRRGHVMYIEAAAGNGQWLIRDYIPAVDCPGCMYATCEATSLSTRARSWQAAERQATDDLKTRECYEHAAAASSRAKRTEQAAVRKTYFELERQWVRLARSYEVSEQVTDFTGELTRRLHAFAPDSRRHPPRGLSDMREENAAHPS